jgi:hypothetical protein
MMALRYKRPKQAIRSAVGMAKRRKRRLSNEETKVGKEKVMNEPTMETLARRLDKVEREAKRGLWR